MPTLIKRREQQTGGKRSKVTWQVQFPTGLLKEDGKPEYIYKTFEKEAEAKAHLRTLKGEEEDGGVVKAATMPLAEFLNDHWLPSVDTSLEASTASSYRQMARMYLIPKLGGKRLCNLTPTLIQHAYDELIAEGKSSRTVRYAHSVLHSALDQAVAWRKLRGNPSNGTRKPREEKTREIRPLELDEQRRVLAAAQEERLGIYFVLALSTGMRPGELFGLKWKDVDLDAGIIQVKQTLQRGANSEWKLAKPKTKTARRSIPVPPETVAALREWKARQSEERMEAGNHWRNLGLALTTLDGGPVERRNFRHRTLTAVAKGAGLAKEIPRKRKGERGPQPKPKYIPGFSLYDLRHSHATQLLKDGINVKVVSERLGHANIGITLDTYAHVLPSMQQDASDRIGSALFGSGKVAAK